MLILLLVCIALSSLWLIISMIRAQRFMGADMTLGLMHRREMSRLERLLALLDISMRPVLFVAGVWGSSVMIFVIFLGWFPGNLLLASLALMTSLLLVGFLLHEFASRRIFRFEGDLIQALDMLEASLKLGDNLRNGLRLAGSSSLKAARRELMQLVYRLDMGLSLNEACARMLRLYPCESVRLFTAAMISAERRGMSFASLLPSLLPTLHERYQMRRQLRAELSGARYSLLVIALLPYAIVPFILWKEPDWLTLLLDHPLGSVLLLGAVCCQILGFAWLRQMMRKQP
ncbi:type II secretion system F family protein [Cobetia amphilecti]|uniref:type II secretion system F family protein n=1 Tax=Cobetia amphilecti TaxID=1055104 RepID=UPI00329940FF